MIKACIFDLDGTLTDTIESLTYSVRKTLEEMGLSEITKEQCRCFVGNGARVLMEKAIRAGGDIEGQRIDEAMEVYGRIFDDNCTYHVVPYEGITDLLTELKSRGIKAAVLSNKPHRQTVKVTEAVFGKGAFDCVQGQKDSVPRKPAPDGVYAAMERMGVSGEEVLYIGDSEVDVETGRNAGVKTLAAAWGFRTEKELKDAGAQYLIYEPLECCAHLA